MISDHCDKITAGIANLGHQDRTKITEVNLSAFIYRLFHDDISSIVRTNPVANSSMCVRYFNLVGQESNVILTVVWFRSIHQLT